MAWGEGPDSAPEKRRARVGASVVGNHASSKPPPPNHTHTRTHTRSHSPLPGSHSDTDTDIRTHMHGYTRTHRQPLGSRHTRVQRLQRHPEPLPGFRQVQSSRTDMFTPLIPDLFPTRNRFRWGIQSSCPFGLGSQNANRLRRGAERARQQTLLPSVLHDSAVESIPEGSFGHVVHQDRQGARVSL